MRDILVVLAAISLFIFIIVSSVQISRWARWSGDLQDRVTLQVCSLVKPEYLVDPVSCNG